MTVAVTVTNAVTVTIAVTAYRPLAIGHPPLARQAGHPPLARKAGHLSACCRQAEGQKGWERQTGQQLTTNITLQSYLELHPKPLTALAD